MESTHTHETVLTVWLYNTDGALVRQYEFVGHVWLNDEGQVVHNEREPWFDLDSGIARGWTRGGERLYIRASSLQTLVVGKTFKKRN